MLGELLQPEIEELIAKRDFSALREALCDLPTADIADVFVDFPPERVAVLFRILPREKATDVFEYLPVELQEPALRALGQEQVAAVLNEMDPDDRTALLEEMPGEAAQRLIGLLSADERRIAMRLLGYPEESIGRRMTPDYVAVHSDWTIADVLTHLRRVGKDKETLNTIFVIDERGRLIDDIFLRDIILAEPDDTVASLMDGHIASLHAQDDQEEAVRAFKKYDRTALPVTDSGNVLVGIVTVDDVLDVAEEEETEDVHKMAAVHALEEPYLDASALTMVKKRAPWLILLFFGELLTIQAMHRFEDTLKALLVLAAFIPLIISAGGNTGSQAASLVIRALALGELSPRDWWRVVRRELASGLMFGSILGMLAFAVAYFFGRYAVDGGESTREAPALLAFIVGTALVGVVLTGTLLGSLLPLALKAVRMDPAVSSAPAVATLVDVTGIVIYFTAAVLLLEWLG
jgi:magnesium transporter